ncbi:MAG: DUF378 domain-containing protein [Clostridiaceae bacterium]
MYKFSSLDKISFILIIIGAINWGLLGLFNFNLVGFIFGSGAIARIVYILIGVAGVVMLIFLVRSKNLLKKIK